MTPRSAGRARARALAAAGLAVAAAAPFALSGFHVFQLTQVAIYAIAILGLVVVTGRAGQVSLGHGAFYGMGAYAVAIAVDHGWPAWAAVALAGPLCAAAAVVFARPVLRLEGPALALATFALAAALPPLLRHDALSPWTGGVQGIAIDRPAPPLPGLDGDQWLYLVVLAVAIALHVAAHNLVQGRMGRALVALRDHPSAAAAMGIDGARVRSLAFGVAGLCAGVAGGLSALVTGFVSPDGFTVLLSIQLLVGAVVGGLGSILGGVAGAIFLVVVPGLASDLSEGAPWAIEGAVTIAVALFLPRGVAGWVRAARARK